MFSETSIENRSENNIFIWEIKVGSILIHGTSDKWNTRYLEISVCFRPWLSQTLLYPTETNQRDYGRAEGDTEISRVLIDWSSCLYP